MLKFKIKTFHLTGTKLIQPKRSYLKARKLQSSIGNITKLNSSIKLCYKQNTNSLSS